MSNSDVVEKRAIFRRCAPYDLTRGGKQTAYEGKGQVANRVFNPQISDEGRALVKAGQLNVDLIVYSMAARSESTASAVVTRKRPIEIVQDRFADPVHYKFRNLVAETEWPGYWTEELRARFFAALVKGELVETMGGLQLRFDKLHAFIHHKSKENVLIVTHGSFMAVMHAALHNVGFWTRSQGEQIICLMQAPMWEPFEGFEAMIYPVPDEVA